MIVITATDTEITVTGHAGHGPPGGDIVCAAVSALVQTLAEALERLAPERASWSLEEGNAVIRVEHPSQRTAVLLDAFCIGVTAISREYPDYVKMI